MKRLAIVGALLGPACGGGATKPPAAPAPAGHAAHAGHHGHHAGHAAHDFADAAHWATVFDDPARDAWQKPDEVVALLAPGPGQIVADIGAGTGYFEPYLTRAVGGAGKILALDSEPAMVAYIAQRATAELWSNVVAQVIAADDPGLPTAGVDRVLIVDTWHHLPDRPRYAAKLALALRPGGTLAVVDFTRDAPMGPPAVARLDAATVAAELTAAGLVARIADESLPHQYVVLATKPTR
ncbi:MAG: methyltransferase domain-containing protein [Myxococcales bacterium]|nr:methyltransferase domain-containing protein [Myxococcales bacterium]MBK7194120.1 methyltransferase domain-containing protein [Myxococcales bacterium]MBP6842539.1 methyltransferase domain-containing protein [Kofleriaceae bacterium]